MMGLLMRSAYWSMGQEYLEAITAMNNSDQERKLFYDDIDAIAEQLRDRLSDDEIERVRQFLYAIDRAANEILTEAAQKHDKITCEAIEKSHARLIYVKRFHSINLYLEAAERIRMAYQAPIEETLLHQNPALYWRVPLETFCTGYLTLLHHPQ